jgi:Yip1 domain
MVTEGGTVLELVERVRAILNTPQTEWPVVAGESNDILAIRYVAILALIPALARFIGGWLIGGYIPFLAALIGAVVAYALSFVVVSAVALVVDLLAPKFGGQRSYSRALRLTAYSFTPLWLAGVVLLVPGASFLVLLGLYGLYLMWVGLPVLMQTPSERALPYVIATAACAIALEIAVRLALMALIGAMQ